MATFHANSNEDAERRRRRAARRSGAKVLRTAQGVARQGLATGYFAAVLLVCGSLRGFALEPSTPLQNYGRQSWVMENGLPQNTVQALAQTRDGFLWLGTEVGLVRFDGNSFQVFDRNSTPALPGNDVRCLLAASDGALWIGTSEGLARWKDGAVNGVHRERRAAGERDSVVWWNDGRWCRGCGSAKQMRDAVRKLASRCALWDRLTAKPENGADRGLHIRTV